MSSLRSLCFFVVILFATSITCDAQTCADTTFYSASSGIVGDGSGDADYSTFLDCFWLIDPPGDDIVRIEFTDFHVVSSGYIDMYDGTSTTGTYLGRFDQDNEDIKTIQPAVYATSGSVFLNFVTAGVGYEGWELRYATVASLGCQLDETLQYTSGILDDGSGAQNYGPNLDCGWHIQSTNNQAIVLTFSEFDIHASDVVNVYEGSSTSGTLLGAFTGATLPEQLVAVSGDMFVSFETDGANESSGWTAKYENIPTFTSCCGELDDGAEGGNYDALLDQWYVIETDCDDLIRLSFTEFALGSGDRLTLYDGLSTTSSVIGSYTGATIPPVQYATSGSVLVHMSADNSEEASGWALSYVVVSTSANTILTSNSGSFQDGPFGCDYPSNTTQTWTISSTTNQVIFLEFTGFNVHPSDSVRVYEGANTNGTLLGSFTGSTMPSIQVALGGEMFIVFESDNGDEAAGWSADFKLGQVFEGCTGSFDDGSGDDDYAINLDQYYLIQPGGSGLIQLDFDGILGARDDIRVFDGTSKEDPDIFYLMANFGSKSVIASSGSALIYFHSGSAGTAAGWNVQYTYLGDTNSYVLNSPSGSIVDGSGDCDYVFDIDRTWTISSTTNQIIGLNFTEFDVHTTDVVRVYDESTSGTLLGSFTGSTVPSGLLYATSGTMLVVFETDGADEAGGWSADFSEVPWTTTCSGTLADGSGAGDYANDDRRFYMIETPCELTRIGFTDFDVAAGDTLFLYNGSTLDSDVLAAFSGSTLPEALLTTSSSVLLEFVTNESSTAGGWDLVFSGSNYFEVNSISPTNHPINTASGTLEVGGDMVGITTIGTVSRSTSNVVMGSMPSSFTWNSSTSVTVHVPGVLLSTVGTLELTFTDFLLRTTSTTVTIVEPLFARHDYSAASGSRTIHVLANDDIGAAALLSAGSPRWGTVTVTGSSITYTPDPMFYGLDNFEYTIGFAGDFTSTGTVTAYTRPNGTSDKTLTQLERVQQGGEINRLKRPRGAVVSADGEHLYVAAYSSRAVSHFTRAGNGELTYVDNMQGSNQGLTSITQVALSPDGEFLYTTSRSEFAVGIYSVHATTGSLTYVGKAVRNVDGVDGLKYAEDIVVSPDGRHVYTVSSGDHKLTVFQRNQTTGTLTYVERFKDGQGGVTKMRTPRAVAVSPDGNHVYVAAYADNAVNVFSRAEETGKLTFVQHRKDNSGGVDGIYGASGVAVSPDGEEVFVSGYRDNALAVFARNQTTGTLTYTERFKDNKAGVDGLAGAYQTRTAPSGQHVFTAGKAEHSVSHIGRNATTGAATYIERVKRNTDGVTGLYKLYNIAVDPESNTLYAMGNYDNSVTVFELDSRRKRGADNTGHTQQPTEALAITNVYPMPASDEVTIAFGETYSNLMCTVLDQAGREVLRVITAGESQQLQLNTTELASGVYFLLLEGLSGQETQLAFVEIVVVK